jgi:hypothetical protein
MKRLVLLSLWLSLSACDQKVANDAEPTQSPNPNQPVPTTRMDMERIPEVDGLTLSEILEHPEIFISENPDRNPKTLDSMARQLDDVFRLECFEDCRITEKTTH